MHLLLNARLVRGKNLKAFKIITRIISIIIVAVLCLVLMGNILNIMAQKNGQPGEHTVFGLSYRVIISGSMSGTIEVNDMIVTCKQKEYEVGDIVTFKHGKSLTTHRIVGEADGGFITKGDANNTEDLDVLKPENIVGKVVFVIPKIGAAMEFMQKPLGMLILIVVGFAVLIIPELLGKDKKSAPGRNKNEKKKKQIYTPKNGIEREE